MIVKTLDQLDRGSRGEVLALSDRCDRSSRLRRLGIREGVVVEVMSDHDPVMIRVEGSCVAVGREMLREVTICRCGCEKEDSASQREAAKRRAAGRGEVA